MSDRLLLTIITPVIRLDGVVAVAQSIAAATPHNLEIRHIVAYYPFPPDPSCGPLRAAWATELLRMVDDGWVLWVDDDNRLHPDLPARLAGLITEHPDAWAFVFDSQYTGAAHGLIHAAPGQMRPGSIDGGQVVLWWWLAQQIPWPTGECADGQYLSTLYQRHKDAFVFVNEPLAYHNHQVWRPHLRSEDYDDSTVARHP